VLVSAGNGTVAGHALADGREVGIALEAVEGLAVPGLAGVTLQTTSGLELSLDRSPGGLAARRTASTGGTCEWTVLGASRGEGGILGEGVRQALLRDPTYREAVGAARQMLP